MSSFDISYHHANVLSYGERNNIFFQPKLTINNQDDKYEQEADAVADKVMRMETPSLQKKESNNSFFKTSPVTITPVQRKCAHCEEEEKKLQRKEMNEEEATADNDLESYVGSLSSSGQPLPNEIRNFYEPRFRYDFSNVKVHTDTVAAKSAQSINALAYTSGSNIVFNNGQYAPNTDSGKRLLGHELTHVVQSNTSGVLRRATADFRISDLPGDAASDSSKIFFDIGSIAISAAESGKIGPLATPAGRSLTLHGFASEEGSAASRSASVTGRLNAVKAALVAAGHSPAAIVQVPHPAEGIGDVDYRHRRAVEVLPTPMGLLSAPTTVNPCGVAGAEVASGTALTACEAAFTTAFPRALAIVNAAESDVVTTPTPAANALVTTFFSGVPRADVNANVSAIAAQVRQLPARHQCHTSCDGGCGRPAYNSGTGLGAGGAMMTICPDWVSSGPSFQTEILIHESAHGNPVEAINDIAYSNTRLIRFLLPADSRRNTDSYVLLMHLVHTPGSMAVGPATPDILSGMTAAGPGSDTEQTQRAVAWLESWLNYGDFDTEILYNTINASRSAGAWVTSGTNEFNIETMHRLAIAFGAELHDPGVDGSARVTPPTERDKVNVAAIHDRFDQMYDVVNQHQLTAVRGAAEGWGSQAAIPRLTHTVTVLPSFFALSAVDQVKHLVRLMARARSDISSSFREKYVTALDLIHTHRTLGP